MGCEVFANSNAIACKAGDGKVIAAFPDVCLSPPSPPAGPIPVPYPDTSFSKDMQNGSKTVKIKGKEVMLKDKSFYKTSPLGDEAATRGLGANIITHVITGKTYFVAWSMDVKIEGANVDRHIDLTTSNHASPTAGEPVPQPDTEGASKSDDKKPKCDHEYDCKPIERKPKDRGKTKQERIDDLRLAKKEGDLFEARAVEHNDKDIADGDDIGLSFRCKKCGATREVDHVTRDKNGNITKIVQCKSDQSKAKGGDSEKGVIIKPKQLIETRKIREAIKKCQADSGVEPVVEYKLEAGDAAEHAKKFLYEDIVPTSVP